MSEESGLLLPHVHWAPDSVAVTCQKATITRDTSAVKYWERIIRPVKNFLSLFFLSARGTKKQTLSIKLIFQFS